MYETVGPEHVIIAPPSELIFLAMTALLEPGDTVVATFPGYASLYEIAASKGCTVRRWEPRKDAAGRFKFHIEDVRPLLDDGAVKMLTINFPHNPMGDLLSRGDMAELVGLAEARGAWLFSDEMYRGLELDAVQRLPSAVDKYSKAITLCGLSKAYSCPGLRIGWLATRSVGALQEVLALKDYTSICNSAPSEALAIMALRQQQMILGRNMAIVQSNVRAAGQVFGSLEGLFEWHPPLAGTMAFPRLKVEGIDVKAWATELVDKAGVLLLPANVYDHEPSIVAGHFRIGLGRSTFKKCLKEMTKALDAMSATSHGH